MWLYRTVVDSQHVTACCTLTSRSGERWLLTARSSHLDLYHIDPTKTGNAASTEDDAGNILTLVESAGICGPVAHLELLDTDCIVCVNRKAQFTVIVVDVDSTFGPSSSAQGPSRMRAIMRGTLEDNVVRPLARGSLLAVDPAKRFFVYVGCQGILRLVPILRHAKTDSSLPTRNKTINFGHIRNVRLMELNVLSIAFFDQTPPTDAQEIARLVGFPTVPTKDVAYLAVLYEESQDSSRVRTYRIDWSSPTTFSDTRHFTSISNISLGVHGMKHCHLLLPLPNQHGMYVLGGHGLGWIMSPRSERLDKFAPAGFCGFQLSACQAPLPERGIGAYLLSSTSGQLAQLSVSYVASKSKSKHKKRPNPLSELLDVFDSSMQDQWYVSSF